MKSKEEIKANATRLRELLQGQGIELNHSESLEVISKLEGYADWNTHTAYISKREQIAEQYLDDMLEGHAEMNYAKFSKYANPKELEEFTKRDFMRVNADLKEDLGPYVEREYLGAISGESNIDPVEEYPGGLRHVWRGVFEKHEVFIHLGIFVDNGTHYAVEAKFK